MTLPVELTRLLFVLTAQEESQMRNNFFSALILATVVLFSATLTTSAASAQTANVSMRSYKGVRAVVSIKLNGAGPYDFLVDTGATITVLDAALFQELKLTP